MARSKLYGKQEFTRLYLWRHPEVRGGTEGIVYGHTDTALSSEGARQLEGIADYMSAKKVSAVYGSDLQRSQLVAQAVGRGQQPSREPVVEQDLRELYLGQWEGLSYQSLMERYPEEMKARWDDLAGYRVPGGESLNDLARRVAPAFERIIEDNRGGRVCIIGHAGVNRVFLAGLLGMPLEHIFRLDQAYACLNLIDVFDDGVPLVRTLNQRVVG
jgi:alpha-ribazole phosphatase